MWRIAVGRTTASRLKFAALCGSVAAIALSHFSFVKDISMQLKRETQLDDAVLYKDAFLPPISASNARNRRQNRRQNRRRREHAAANSLSRFPIRTHIVTQGEPRTATTLLFNMVGVSYFLYLAENEPEKIPDVQLLYSQRNNARKIMRKSKSPHIFKTHSDLNQYLSKDAVVFSAAADRKEAVEMRERLERDGHKVAFVQDMETLKENGLASLVDVYVTGYGLSEINREILNDYFSKWEILRQCCGKQMSSKWRNDLMPEKYKIETIKSHPTCGGIDIDGVEQAFMKTKLFSLIEEHPSVRDLNKVSLKDDNLNGTYCSSFNNLVRTQGLNFWGMPGGRPVRSKLDSAIKSEFKLGKEGLKLEAHYLFPPSDKTFSKRLAEMFKLPTEEKKAWLKAIVAAREGGKTYSDYGIETATSADSTNDIFNDDSKDNGHVEGNTSEESELGDDLDDEYSEDLGTDDTTDNISDDDVQENGQTEVDKADESELGDDLTDGNTEDLSTERSSHIYHKPPLEKFDDTRAIFLISFGEEAAKSTLVERCVLSLRRRGAWDGYVVLLTDAPPERYQKEWDENVIVMHPLEKHLNAGDGTPFEFSENNLSLKPKRFKTFIIDYMDMEKRLDSVELIYYLDIDIMAGDSLIDLFSGVESKYEVSREERDGGLSKLYFFTPLSKEWPLQGGTFIVERRSSRHCLELWRKEIDAMTVSGRGRDQDGLRNIYQLAQSGVETKCDLVRMDNDNFISFPTPRTFKKDSQQSRFPSLIHISNSKFAKWIDEDAQTAYIHKVLELSEEEKLSRKYGKAVINPKKSD
ncbi:hypothetical protein ACHAW5_009394 [Stephanodiscus triporus]|uniref:Uncharacterized protein n=1 Tax=Stephanodiscus triporus TaxID=2934178 RepID=A0ABD3PKM9_9STRA